MGNFRAMTLSIVTPLKADIHQPGSQDGVGQGLLGYHLKGSVSISARWPAASSCDRRSSASTSAPP